MKLVIDIEANLPRFVNCFVIRTEGYFGDMDEYWCREESFNTEEDALPSIVMWDFLCGDRRFNNKYVETRKELIAYMLSLGFDIDSVKSRVHVPVDSSSYEMLINDIGICDFLYYDKNVLEHKVTLEK